MPKKLKKETKYHFSAKVTIQPPVLVAPSLWLKVTSKKTGLFVYLPLPIRLIQQLPDEQGGGCLVRGACGDESTTKENIVEIFSMLNACLVSGDISCWSLAG
jgi:hypothetical protein